MNFAFKYPHKYKLCGWKVISGERGGQAIGPPRPIRLSGKLLSIQLRIRRARGGCSCAEITFSPTQIQVHPAKVVEVLLQENLRKALHREDPVLHMIRLCNATPTLT
jgi:hypothetical protein